MARLTSRLIQGVLFTGAAAALAMACSASPDGSHFQGSSGGSGSSNSSGGSGAGYNLSGGSSNSGGSGAGYNFGGANSGGSGGNTIGDACAVTHNDGKQLPLDMYIMMDKSGSMGGAKWNGVKSAITSFVNAGAPVAGIGVGIQFFPQGGGSSCNPLPPCTNGCVNFGGICIPGNNSAECNINSYLPPAVTIQPLPGVAQQIISAISANSPGGGTPTLPAMQSAVQATTAYAKQHPDHKVIIVLATDGDPNDCNSKVANVSSEAAKALAANPSVLTFVIGIGTVANMDQIAQAGGSQKSYQVDAANANKTFLDAMNAIRGKALGCEFLLPKPSGNGTIDFSKVNVYYTQKGANKGNYLPQVQNASQCKSNPGWYYDNPNSPTKIVLCPASCDQVKNAGGSVDIQLGCQTIVAPPA